MGAPESRKGREPAPPAEGGNRLPAKPAEAVATAGPDLPVTSWAGRSSAFGTRRIACWT